jgi:hypothetical protein
MAAALAAAPHRRGIKPAAPPIAQHVVVGTGEVLPLSQARECLQCWVGQRHEPVAAAFGQSLHTCRETAADQQCGTGRVDILPPQRECLADPHPGVEEQTQGVRILAVLQSARLLLASIRSGRRTVLLARMRGRAPRPPRPRESRRCRGLPDVQHRLIRVRPVAPSRPPRGRYPGCHHRRDRPGHRPAPSRWPPASAAF